MKKSIVFIMVLLVIFSCLFTKLDDDYHVIPANFFTATVKKNKDNKPEKIEYNFSDNVGQIPENIKAEADKISKKYNSAAVQIAVMKNFQLQYTYEYGYADYANQTAVTSDSIYRVASLSKFVTDAVFMKLCDLGKVSIDDDISDLLGFKVRNPQYPDIAITPAMLMSHSGTVVDSTTFEASLAGDSTMTLRQVLEAPYTLCVGKPGEFYFYSNFSVAVVGAICELVTGRYFNELAKEYFFDPLGIDASYLASELKNTNLVADLSGLNSSTMLLAKPSSTIGQTHHLVQGNLFASAKDYLKFVAMIAAGGVTENGERLLSAESVKEMLKTRIYDAAGIGSGFGCEENSAALPGRTIYSHTGDAYGMYSVYAFDPKTGDGIVVLTSGASSVYLDSVGINDNCYEYVKLMFPQIETKAE